MNRPRLITLESWLQATYGEDAPSILTARRWAREGRIDPAPKKHGRAYFVEPAATYSDTKAKPGVKMSLISRIEASHGSKAA